MHAPAGHGIRRMSTGAPRPADATRSRHVTGGVVFLVVAIAALYVLLPKLAGLDETWNRIDDGDPAWLIAALGFEALSYLGYLVLFQGVLDRQGHRITTRDATEITFAGVAATRLLAMAGAGGIALTAWALRRLGLLRSAVAVSLSTFFVVLYAVFMATLLLVGLGLWTGVLAGPAPAGLTLVPAAFGGAVIAIALALALVPPDLGVRRGNGTMRSVALVPAAFGAGVRGALAMLRGADPHMLGALAWWGFDVAVLWAAFHAFGEPPDPAVLVMAYFVGMLANVLPLPGGIGGVEGGMIAASIGFGVSAGLAVVAVLTYRAIAFWLPSIPGAIAYVRLRRRFRDGGDT